jgi:large subunit ribosomal protein L18
MKSMFRRRRQGVTDYLKRRNLLSSQTPRVIFRKTNKYVIAQYVTSQEAKDKVEIGLTSKNLLSYGWPKDAQGSLKSIMASYLTGFLMGKKILKGKKKTPIFDMGRISPVHKTKPFAFLKGIVDAGVEMGTKKDDIFPEEERIQGKSLLDKGVADSFDKIKSNIEKI